MSPLPPQLPAALAQSERWVRLANVAVEEAAHRSCWGVLASLFAAKEAASVSLLAEQSHRMR